MPDQSPANALLFLRDEDLHSWFLDPDISLDKGRQGLLSNQEPLLVNLENTWVEMQQVRQRFFLTIN